MEVYTTNDFAYDGNIYHPELDLEQPKGCLSYTSNHIKNSRKINNRFYDINTSNYKKLTTNKDAKVIELYDDLEDYVLKKDRKITRNYLLKGIFFKYRCRILEVTLKEQEMILCSLKYKMRVGDENSLNYAKYLIDKEKIICIDDNISDTEYYFQVFPIKNYLYADLWLKGDIEYEDIYLRLNKLIRRFINA